MSPNPMASGSVRSAAVVDEEIRAVWQHAGGHLTTTADRARYEQLVVEWAAAVRAEQNATKAA